MNEDEKQLTEKVEQEVQGRANNLNDQNQGLSIVERAEVAAKILKAENDRKEALINVEKEMQARQILGGRANAGQANIQKTQQEIDAEEAARILQTYK